jgi:Protein of unknown function (DUF1588)/Protein of unknown function (DUF1592)/Protein of unknown function (DUF1595)/Protein of unknown function (DUF1587)
VTAARITVRLGLVGALAFGAAACRGKVGGLGGVGSGAPGATSPGTTSGAGGTGAMSGGAGSGAPSSTDTSRASTCATGASNQPGYRMVRRLSQNEYNATMRSVFGLDTTSWQDIEFPGELAEKGHFENYSDALSIDATLMAALSDKTFDRAQTLLAGTQAAAILGASCNAASPDAACAESVIRTYGYRLFRRPVTDAEVTSYVGLFNQGISDAMLAPTDALAGTLAALMQSPNTLYISQLGSAAGAIYKLGPYEIASVLAYGLTGAPPTSDLLDRAGQGALGSPSGIATEAQTLLTSAAGQAHVQTFFKAWLQYDAVPFVSKDATVYDLPSTTLTAMVTESQMLLDDTYGNGKGLADLLLSPTTYVNLSLAKHYNWDTTGLTDDKFVARQRPAGQGVGFLAQGGTLTRLAAANSSSPTQRGLFVLNQLICKTLPPPPATVPNISPPSGTVTTRERYEDVHAVGSCAVCHAQIDHIGFGFENFDGAGVYRTTEVGQPIDASGEIIALNDVKFNGPEDLAQKLAAAPEVAQCLAAQLTSFVYGVSSDDGLCIAPPSAYPAGANLGFKDVLAQVVGAAQLTTRSP